MIYISCSYLLASFNQSAIPYSIANYQLKLITSEKFLNLIKNLVLLVIEKSLALKYKTFIMEYQSPQAEKMELHSIQLNNRIHVLELLKKNDGGGSGVIMTNNDSDNDNLGIDSVLDDTLIPSPPMSPRLQTLMERCENSVWSATVEPVIVTGLQVKPIWPAGQTVKKYSHANYGFLSHYKSFKSKIGSKSYPNSFNSRHMGRRQKVSYTSSSEIESSYITRNVARKFKSRVEIEEYNAIPEENANKNQFERPTTPIRRVRKVVSSITSPLASHNAITGVSQYVPNMSWEKLVDCSPSLSTLPADNVNCLKIEWKGSSIDLTSDPLKDRLHPAELILAQTLRLPCDLYIDSKRRFFLEKLYRLKKGLPFRRTDAQKACKIDVNKASRLYAAFERIGWLRDSHFYKHL